MGKDVSVSEGRKADAVQSLKPFVCNDSIETKPGISRNMLGSGQREPGLTTVSCHLHRHYLDALLYSYPSSWGNAVTAHEEGPGFQYESTIGRLLVHAAKAS